MRKILDTLHALNLCVLIMKDIVRGYVLWPENDKEIEIPSSCYRCSKIHNNPSNVSQHRSLRMAFITLTKAPQWVRRTYFWEKNLDYGRRTLWIAWVFSYEENNNINSNRHCTYRFCKKLNQNRMFQIIGTSLHYVNIRNLQN